MPILESIGTIFSQEVKPLEVEILVVGVGRPKENELYRISFDGSIFDEKGFTVVGGRANAIMGFLKNSYKPDFSLKDALKISVEAFEGTNEQKTNPSVLEAAVLDRKKVGRRFRRLSSSEVKQHLKS
jgi:proteasome alpha subunit